MSPDRFEAIVQRYPALRLVVVGDFCLDRYLEIDPARVETSLETGLPVHNVVRVRSQPGAAGTILNNLVALGVGTLHPVGFTGIDGEGFELRRTLATLPGVHLDHFLETSHRRTFVYCKPLVMEPGKPPRELNRLDSKNWSPTPGTVSADLARSLEHLAPTAMALVALDQVDHPDTGVITPRVREILAGLRQQHPTLPILADSRRGLRGFPPLIFKMNHAELGAFLGLDKAASIESVRNQAARLAVTNQQAVFVTLAEQGIVAASPDGQTVHVPALPTRGPIDIVGAGDAVTANLAAALAAGASVPEAVALATLAASIVLHQLGTTGTASVSQLRELLPLLPRAS